MSARPARSNSDAVTRSAISVDLRARPNSSYVVVSVSAAPASPGVVGVLVETVWLNASKADRLTKSSAPSDPPPSGPVTWKPSKLPTIGKLPE
jgi:hypothetical protein